MIISKAVRLSALTWLIISCWTAFGAGEEHNPLATASDQAAAQSSNQGQALQQAMTVVGVLALIVAATTLWIVMLRRKVQEHAGHLQQSEAKFRSLVEQALVGVYIIQNGRFVYVNPRLAEIYGYTPEEILELTIEDTIHKDDLPMVKEQIRRRVMGEAKSVHYTFRGLRKDGSVVHVEVLGSRTDIDGKPAVLGTALDVTQRKHADQELAEASSLLETMLENSPDYIYFKDRQSRFVRHSRSLAAMFHVDTANGLVGKTDFDFFLEEHARAAFEDEQQIIRTGKPIVGKPEKETHADGRTTWALTSKLPWRDKEGNIIGTFGISKDVTAAKEVEDKLAYERELFQSLLDNLPDSIYFKDVESRFVRVSKSKAFKTMEPAKRAWLARHPGETELPAYFSSVEEFAKYLVGKSDFDTYDEEFARGAYEEEKAIMTSGNPVIGKLEQSKDANGAATWTLITKMPWRDKDGKVIGTFGVSRDITLLKEAEARLEAAHQRLVETSRLAGMAEVATDVLHNVGNVLNSVNVSCSLSIDRIRDSKVSSLTKVSALLQENQARLGEFLTQDPRGQQIPGYVAALSEHLTSEQAALLKELEQLLRHIDHIKQIVSMQQSYAKVAGVVETISPAQLVEDALQINAAALSRHDVHVRREFAETAPIVTEKHKVLQILVNLIRNAKYAMDEARRQDKLLTVKVSPTPERNVKIEVIDNGIGIPQENLTRIFSHGFTTKKDGHGFGLHSSALAVRDLGGSIQAQSEGIGKGAAFTLLLPPKAATPVDKAV